MTRSIASSSATSVDGLLVGAGGEQGGLVEHVGEVGAAEARRAPADRLQVDARGDRLAARVHLQDLGAALEVGRLDADLPVEAARAQQRRVEHVGTVGGRDQDDAAAHVEAVHLDEQLVERLLALVVAAAHAGAAVAPDRVDLVDEDDGRRVLLGLLEQVAHAAGADADEHLDEVGAGDRVERHAGLTGDGAGEQRLAGAGRAVEQDALGDLGADGLELGRLLQELLDLAELLDGLVAAGDVGERRLGGVLGDELGPRLGELHDPSAAALHVVHQEEQQQAEDQDDRQEAEAGTTRRRSCLGTSTSNVLSFLSATAFSACSTEPGALVAEPLGAHLLAVLEGRLDLLVALDERDVLDLARRRGR